MAKRRTPTERANLLIINILYEAKEMADGEHKISICDLQDIVTKVLSVEGKKWD